MASVRFSDDKVPDYVERFEKIPAPYRHALSSYDIEGFSSAMIAWMLDINVRASIKRREFLRTRIRIGLYIKYMERLLQLNGIPYEPYLGTEGNEMITNARKIFIPHMRARFVHGAPVPLTIPIKSSGELSRTVSDTQTMEYKLHQLEVIRYMGRTDPPSLEEFIRTTRVPRPETEPK